MFSVCVRTVQRIWLQAMTSFSNGVVVDVSNKKPKRVGRKRVQIDCSKVSEIPLRQQTNIRSLSFAMQVAKSTLHRRIKEGFIRPHSNALTPYLLEENKRQGLYTWFYMSKELEKYYLLPEEAEPVRTCKSKRFITKVMFLAAVARPRFDTSRNEMFLGKIGIYPFTCKAHAKQSSKNHVAGTLKTKPMWSVTKEDNAKPHVNPLDTKFLEDAAKDGFDIRLSFQPPNSPDLNVLDLGFFRAIQSLQYQQAPKTVDELVDAVEKAFNELPTEALNHIFRTLQ
ncbi:uncharacterized protein LOC132301684 [Cornus florida]|uniref:uncharacterized protein LOC132301684 n=1 Tax=Cornus florida TaxID=4283 RepID=UPI00289EE33E|nr:uncharacterized protein LOC132301684 [Cornus florida]